MTLLAPAVSTRTDAGRTPTPVLELHVPTAVARFHRLRAALPGTAVHYAVKANPHPVLLRALVAAGASFDVASPTEVQACLDRRRAPGRPRLLQPHQAAHGHRRVRGDGRPAVRGRHARGDPQGRRGRAGFRGALPARDLRRAARTGRCRASTAARPRRPSTCSGSPPSSGSTPPGCPSTSGRSSATPPPGTRPIEASSRIFAALREAGLRPWLLDLGGGFPAAHEGGCAVARRVRRRHPEVARASGSARVARAR